MPTLRTNLKRRFEPESAEQWKTRQATSKQKRVRGLFQSRPRKLQSAAVIALGRKRTTVSVKLDPNLWRIVKIEAVVSGREFSEIVEEALRERLEKSSDTSVKERIRLWESKLKAFRMG